ncbi:MAG: cytochrome c [Candidatus Tectomicrobia bacterium]|nr:cytochrome c [Candidatus Tectomicrobia bacterium]
MTRSDRARKVAGALLLALAVLAATALGAEEPRQAAPLITPPRRTERLQRGKALYAYYCAACHGPRGDGRGSNAEFLAKAPRDFTDAAYMATRSADDLRRVITEGGPGAGLSYLMPAWGRTLRPYQIEDLIAYLRSFAAGGASAKRENHVAPETPPGPSLR